IELQEKEIARRQKELAATINAPADAERYRIEALAKAEQAKRETEARGDAAAKQAIGEGEAAATRAKGMAEADVINATGTAEAEAMNKKADAWKQYNEAAVLQMIIEALPAVAREISAPLAKIDKITVIGNGGGDGGSGAGRITKDVTEIMAQLPPIIESLSGVDLNELLKKLPGIAGSKPVGDGQRQGASRKSG
ncbi:MAG: flotillin family protein, partial [Planctomycetota bacterium]|nr:flotillin family protein [Planctomycetota bacterium]